LKYMGSKARIAKEILPIMLAARKPNQWWVEPFCGGCNMIDKVEGNRLGSDADYHCIQALIDIRDNVDLLPKNNNEFTEEMYKQLRANDNYRFKSYVGYTASYSGKWLGGWCRDSEGKRDYVAEAYKNALKQSPKLQGVHLYNLDYKDLPIPDSSIIYCDPPYANTTKYKSSFNHEQFWDWCRQQAALGHTVFVSEYQAPDDFTCVWQKEIASSLTKDTGSKKGVEKQVAKNPKNRREIEYSFLEGENEFWEHVSQAKRDDDMLCLECFCFEQSQDYMEEIFHMQPQSEKGYPDICLYVDVSSKTVKLEEFSYSEFAVDSFFLSPKGKRFTFTDNLSAEKKQEQHDKELHEYWDERIALAEKLGAI